MEMAEILRTHWAGYFLAVTTNHGGPAGIDRVVHTEGYCCHGYLVCQVPGFAINYLVDGKSVPPAASPYDQSSSTGASTTAPSPLLSAYIPAPSRRTTCISASTSHD